VPILRLLNLQLQRQRFSRLGRFFQRRKTIFFVLKTRQATCGVVKIYHAGVVTRDRSIGSWYRTMTHDAKIIVLVNRPLHTYLCTERELMTRVTR
jgi:hypothetical protein